MKPGKRKRENPRKGRLLYYERKLKKRGYNLIIGVDEAGRGPLAGPVVAAAVALNTWRFKNRIDDSKKLTPRLREKAFPEIMEKSVFAVAIVDEKVIDRINILMATCLAMERSIALLIEKLRPHGKNLIHVIVDGNCPLNIKFPFTGIIRGDSKSKSIAAASILAKVTRDSIMSFYDKVYPQYGFSRHKGYPTKSHRLAIKEFGPSRIHRVSFNL